MATAGKPIKCRAAIAWGVNKPYTIETVEVAVPKKGEVRVKMGSTGICHSDLHNLEGIDEKYPFPSVFGHEGAGVIESVGEGVTDLQPEAKIENTRLLKQQLDAVRVASDMDQHTPLTAKANCDTLKVLEPLKGTWLLLN